VILLIWIGRDIVTNPNWIRTDDYVEYWASGRLNLSAGNPYDPNQLLPLQSGTGKNFGLPVMMWNPPWIFPLIMPFSILSYPISRTLWMLALVVVVFICVNTLWTLFGGSDKNRYISWIVGFTFYPVLEALKTGQASPLILLGVTGFLYSITKRKYFLAGIFLSFIIIKPHLLYLFGLAVIVWSFQEKRWEIFAGVLTSFLLGTVAALIFNLSLRFYLGPEKSFLQFVAPIFGIMWFIYYWIRYRKSWNWVQQTSLLILVSVFTSAYGWSSDQVVLLVAIIEIAVYASSVQLDRNSLFVVGIYILIDTMAFLVRGTAIVIWWLAPSLLLWYLLSKRLLLPKLLVEKTQTSS
jgi:hypothetical protein